MSKLNKFPINKYVCVYIINQDEGCVVWVLVCLLTNQKVIGFIF